MLLLARTTPLEEFAKRDGRHDAVPRGPRPRPRRPSARSRSSAAHAVDSNEVFYDGLPGRCARRGRRGGPGLPPPARRPEPRAHPHRGRGAGHRPGRAARSASSTRKSGVVFGRPIGQNQGIQFPLAESYAKLAAAELHDPARPRGCYDNGPAVRRRGEHGEVPRDRLRASKPRTGRSRRTAVSATRRSSTSSATGARRG